MLTNVLILNNEVQLLADRLKYEYAFYDKFIITEATALFNGLPKPLYFQEYIELFKPYLDKIKYLVLRTLPKPILGSYIGHQNKLSRENRWPAEILMRDFFINFLDDFNDDDLFIIQDVDEIPNFHHLDKILKAFTSSEKVFSFLPMHWFKKGLTTDCLDSVVWKRAVLTNKHTLYTYESANKLRCARKSESGEWCAPSISTSIKNHDGTPICQMDVLEQIRCIDCKFDQPEAMGWHLSSMHCRNNMLLSLKSSSFSHAEFSKSPEETLRLSLVNPVETLKMAASSRNDLQTLEPFVSEYAPRFLLDSNKQFYI